MMFTQSLPPAALCRCEVLEVRRVRMKALETGRKKMRAVEQARWERHFPGIWERRQEKELYVPGDSMVNAAEWRDFFRAPLATAMLACELCSFKCVDPMAERRFFWRWRWSSS